MSENQTKTCGSCDRKFRGEKDIFLNSNNWRVCEQNYLWFNCECGSTLVLHHDEVSWFNPINGTDNLLNHIAKRENFPRLPGSIFKLQEVLNDPESSAKEIAAVAKIDPFVGAGILLIANKMRQDGHARIDTLEHAVSYIGRDTVKLIALTTALGSLTMMTTSLSAKEFWRDAFLVGSIAEHLAKTLAPKVSTDEAFIAGTLCNIGKLVAAIYTPEIIDKIVASRNEDDAKQWEKHEKRTTPLSHAKFGEFAAAEWGFPTFVLQSISNHHTLPKFGISRPDGLSLEELVAFSNQFSHVISGQLARLDKGIFNSYASIAHLKKSDLKAYLEQLKPVKQSAESLAMDVLGLFVAKAA